MEWLRRLLTDKQIGVQERAIALLKQQGHITVWEVQQLGTTSATKLLYRIKRQGYITGTHKEANANGRGFHHVYVWSGKVA